MRYYVFGSLACAVLSVVAFAWAPSVAVFIVAYALMQFLQPFTEPAVAHLQMATPVEFRGRMTALFGLIVNLMGMCLGPPTVGFITDFVLGDPKLVNLSLAIVYTSASLAIALIFWRALPAARRAVGVS